MRHHKIRLLVCAALLAIAQGLARSQTAATLYGVADLAAYQKQLAGEAKLKTLQSGGMTTSGLGFAASEDLGGGLRALFDISGFVRLDTGDSGRNHRPFLGTQRLRRPVFHELGPAAPGSQRGWPCSGTVELDALLPTAQMTMSISRRSVPAWRPMTH